MATWQSQYSLLTKVGDEILNKLKVGQGAITVSRIVAGSGRVSYVDLRTQTSVSGVQKEFTLHSINTKEDGSELAFEITNSDFNEPYTINQIGVYVTHPDYQGEQLYHISQCDEDNPDEIPAYTDNVVTLGYSLVLVHASSNSITVTVDPSGMVTQNEFNAFKSGVESRFTTIGTSITNLNDSFSAFKAGIKQNKLIASDSNGNLIASGKATLTGSSFTVVDAMTHRALSLSIEGHSTQTPDPTPTSPVYPVDTKVNYIRNASGSGSKLITFPSGVVLRSLGDYEDTIEWDGAKWWKVQRIQEVSFDGVTNGVYYAEGNSSATYCRFCFTSSTMYKTIKDHITSAPIITSHGNAVHPNNTAELYAFHYTSSNAICGHFLNTVTGVSSTQSSAEKGNTINAWLKAQSDAGNPVKIRYVLKTPIVTEISLTEVLEMYASSTNITCNAEGGTPNMQLAYALDTTDDTTMYILRSLTRKSEIPTANTFAEATIVQ